MAILCVGCGVCCDGTLFGDVELESLDDISLLRQIGLITDGEDRMLQPCKAFSHGSCSCYAQRPASCRGYRCKLLVKHEAGAVSLEQARSTIRTMRELVDEARSIRLADAQAWLPLSKRLGGDGAVCERLDVNGQRQLVTLAALDAFTKMHFYDKDAPRAPAEND
jgi:Fe-S-cluster containining protein